MDSIKFNDKWDKIRFSALFKENNKKNEDFSTTNAFQFYFGEIIPKKKYELTKDLIETYKKYTLVDVNDIVINGLNLNYDFVSQRIGVVKGKGIITSAYISLRQRMDFNVNYYVYLFKVMDAMKIFHGLGTGIRLTLSYTDLKNILLPIPPRAEQDQIVRFLDWKVSAINRLIEIKRKEIELLEELKKAFVNYLVTRGLNKNALLKYSGVDWLGDIPAHWSIVKLRQILHNKSEKNRPDLPLLSVVRDKGVIIRDIDDKDANHNYVPEDLSGYKVVHKGQFAMNKMKAWQGSEIV